MYEKNGKNVFEVEKVFSQRQYLSRLIFTQQIVNSNPAHSQSSFLQSCGNLSS